MKKSDLKTGMLVVTRTQDTYIVVKGIHNTNILKGVSGWNYLHVYDDDLTICGYRSFETQVYDYHHSCHDLDIMQVYDLDHHSYFGSHDLGKYKLIWKRSVKLKPCPFCGSEAMVYSLNDTSTKHMVICARNECYLHFGNNSYFQDKNEAISLWNKRSGE